MWTWLLSLLGIAVTKLWEIVWDSIEKEVTDRINDKALQNLAVSIVESFKDKDLTNAQKRENAVALLIAQARDLRVSVTDSVANTLIELAVLYMKNREK